MGLPGVYSIGEIARAANVSEAQVRSITAGRQWFTGDDAERLGRLLVANRRATPISHESSFSPRLLDDRKREQAVPLALSGSLHVALVATAVFGLGAHAPLVTSESSSQTPSIHLVFFAVPGPGGGGGGGGQRERIAPSREFLQGHSLIASPLPPRAPAPVAQAPPPESSPPVTVDGPIASVASDERTQLGVPTAAAVNDSGGPGRGGGAGTNAGGGIGEGAGSGVGPGSGGGFGGGAYRPGSGITPPRVLREVKADYTEAARRRGLTGDVVLEVVVQRDGSVGDVRLLHGLGMGLDERAVAAVRQWRFAPAERQGTPVDVIVEVGVEFRLR